jgi:hypothetical protein
VKAGQYCALLLTLLALGATQAKPRVGFIDLPQLVASDRLHAVLAEYDREIAALRATQSLPGLRDPAQTARNAALAQQGEAAAAQAAVAAIDARDANSDRERERKALATLGASPHAGRDALSEYTRTLARETHASLAAFERATVERDERAYAARAQQLREKELTLAFDLERADAGRRLALRLKLGDLHLFAPQRAKLQAELNALDARELQAVSKQQRLDAATLAAYRLQLAEKGAAANAQMAAQLSAKAAANFAVRRQVALGGSSAERSGLPDRLASFGATYARGADAEAIGSGIRATAADLSQRFAALAAQDRQSQREVAAQLATLQADRIALYRSIVARILRTAVRLARQRGLAGINFTGERPKAGVDLTEAVKESIR